MRDAMITSDPVLRHCPVAADLAPARLCGRYLGLGVVCSLGALLVPLGGT